MAGGAAMSRDLLLLNDADRSRTVAMTNAKEEVQLRRCLGYLDRAQKALVTGIETDQKLMLARFEAMVRSSQRMQTADYGSSTTSRKQNSTERYRCPDSVRKQPIKPIVLISGDQDLSELLGIERQTPTPPPDIDRLSTTSEPSAAGSARRKRSIRPTWRRSGRGVSTLDLQTLLPSSNWVERRKRHHQRQARRRSRRSRSASRSSRSTSASTGTSREDESRRPLSGRVRPDERIGRRPTTAGEQPHGGSKPEEGEVTRVKSAPAATSGSIRRSNRRGRLQTAAATPAATVRFTPAEMFAHPEPVYAPVDAAIDSRPSSSLSVGYLQPGSSKTAEADDGKIIGSKSDRRKTPSKRQRVLTKVASTTVYLQFGGSCSKRPSTASHMTERDFYEPPLPVGYEPEVSDYYIARRQSRMTTFGRRPDVVEAAGVDNVDGETPPNRLDVDKPVNDDDSRQFSSVSTEVDDDVDWARETTAQNRVRSLTLKLVSVNDQSATVRRSEAEVDLEQQRQNQLRRQYRRLAKVAEEQRKRKELLSLVTDLRIF